MANIKISALPTYTGSAADVRWFIMNNSGNTETFKFSGYPAQLIAGTGTDSYRTPNAVASNNSSISIGNLANCAGNLSIAVGDDAQANGVLSMAIGYKTRANVGNGQVCIGWDSSAGDSSVIIGGSNIGTGQESTIVGYNSEVTRNKSNILGTISQITNGEYQNILGGYDSRITSTNNYNNIIGGVGNVISGATSGATLIGLNNYTQPLNSDTAYVNKFYVIGQQIDFPSGSGKIGGTGNTISATGNNNIILSSSGSTISGSNVNHSNIVGGTNNTLTAALGSSVIGGQDHQLYGQWNGIFAGRQHVNNSNYSVCLGGRENDITSTSSEHCGMLAGFQNINSSTGKYNVMIGGFNSTVTGGTNIVTLALTGRTGLSQDNTTYAENVHAFRTYSTKVQTLTSGVTFTFDLNEGGKGQFALTGASTIDITNVRDGQSFLLKTTTTGGHTITWSSTGYTFLWKGADSTPSNNKTDLWRFEVFGTVIYGEKVADFS